MNEALSFLYGLVNYEKGLGQMRGGGLDPMRVGVMLDKAGVDYRRISFIHAAGTKGKGSVSAYCAAILESSVKGPVGLYTSPHLYRINERITVSGIMVSDDEFSAIIKTHRGLISDSNATFFDALTFAAVVHFYEKNCRWAVLETGLGGRLDSTNFCLPRASVITSIGYDHTAILGNTLSAIAAEKAGIIKPGVPVVSGVRGTAPRAVIKRKALFENAPLMELDSRASWRIIDRNPYGSISAMRLVLAEGGMLDLQELSIAQPGDVMVRNFALACLSVDAAGVPLSRQALEYAGAVVMPFRCERRGTLLLDGAHTDDSLDTLCDTVRRYYHARGAHLVLGVLSDKEIPRLARVVKRRARLFSKITVGDFAAGRPTGGRELYSLLKNMPRVEYMEDLSRYSPVSGVLTVITGSFMLASVFPVGNLRAV